MTHSLWGNLSMRAYQLLVAAAAVLLSACASDGENLLKAAGTWKGQPAADLVAHWGPPDRTYEVNGETVYEWATGGRIDVPVGTTGTAQTYGNVTTFSADTASLNFDVTCTRRAMVTPEGQVRTIFITYKNCYYSEEDAEALARPGTWEG